MQRREFIKTAGCFASVVFWRCNPASKSLRPNFVVILADDLGWSDIGCYGNSFTETPNLDQLQRDGMKFTDAYSTAPVCSPARASLLTGRHPVSVNITDWIPGLQYVNGLKPDIKLKVPDFNQQLPLEEKTIAEELKKMGYKTACIGKWHLGEKDYYPEKQGFDFGVGGHHRGYTPTYFYPFKGIDYATKKEISLPYIETRSKEGDYLTDVLTDEAIKFIEQNLTQPFFLYLPYYQVHKPWEAKPELIDKYRTKYALLQDKHCPSPTYSAMVECLDDNVGRLFKTIDDLHLTENTVIIFISDNGAVSAKNRDLSACDSNAPLRSGKGYLYEGGIRVPFIIKWKNQINSSTTCSEPVSIVDIYSTIMDILGEKARTLDGQSLLPLLKQKNGFTRDALYWHYPHFHGEGSTPCGAIRQGPYKLIEYFEDDHIELFNLEKDIGEKDNLAHQFPGTAQKLLKKLQQWRKSKNAKMPDLNPNYEG